MDTLSPEERSERMSRVRGKNTRPERRVRSMAHRLGYRFRLHRRDLPGKPDLVFPRRRVALFVHGCFWHRHEACPLARLPKSRRDFWEPKLESNRLRDIAAKQRLESMGWRVVAIWECETLRDETMKHVIRQRMEEAA